MPDDIRPLLSHEAPLIGGIIANAFADDPVNLWVFNGAGAMRPVFTTMADCLYLKSGFGHVTRDGKAGTLWLPPGAGKAYGIGGNLKMAQAIIRHGGAKAVYRSLAIDAFMAKNRPKEPHYYLFAIGVAPEKQGKGTGGRLMRETLAMVDDTHLPAYLENSKPGNVGFYEAQGFEVIDETEPVKGCPTLWRMWRKPR